MQRHRSAAGSPIVRPVHRIRLFLTKHRRIFVIIMLSLTVSTAATTGFLLGNAKPALASPINDAASVAAFADQLAAQDDLCATVEQINLQQQLASEKQKAEMLADSLDNQKQAINDQNQAINDQNQAIDEQQKEIDELEETILNALMANLSDQLISRSSKSVDSYVAEAKNLVSLSRKLRSFKKTAEADTIDLTSYESAIKKRLSHLPTLKPVPGRVDGYGWRIHPIYHRRQFHPAADMGARKGTPIKAAGAGYVIAAAYNRSAGNFIKLNHGNGFVTTYMHCSKLYVRAGDRVDKGEVIAAVGNTGTSTTAHLHFEIELNGNTFNPNRIIME